MTVANPEAVAMFAPHRPDVAAASTSDRIISPTVLEAEMTVVSTKAK